MDYEKIEKIKLGEKIPFTWRAKPYGWAYFDVCLVIKYNKIRKVFIVPRQQEYKHTYFYEVPDDIKLSWFDISSYVDVRSGEDTKPAVVTMIGHCEKHNARMIKIRVPRNSESFQLTTHFGNELSIEFGNS